MRSRRITRGPLAALVALGLLLAACAGDGDVPAADPGDTAAEADDPGTGVEPFVVDLGDGSGEGMVDTAAFAKEPPYRIGFSNGFSGNSWRAMMLTSLENEADLHPDLIEELIVVDGQGDINKQVSDIESLIAQEVDAIMIIPNSGEAVAPVVRQAVEAGIVVVPFNLPVEDAEPTAYLGTDACDKGRRIAEWLRDQLGGEGGVIALGGIPGNSYTATAWGCGEPVFLDAGMEVLSYRDAEWQEDVARVVCTDLLTALPQIDGIWSDGGQDASGCLKAFEAAGRELPPVTGDDYNGLLKLYLDNRDENPNLDFGILSEPTYESKLALRMVLGILTGGEVPQTWTLAPPLLTGADAETYVKPDLPDAVFFDNDLSDEELAELFAGQ